ncbi:MAG: sigma-54 dependent transcriptional regulator [bacterium]
MTINITDFAFANKLLDAGAMWYCTKYPGDIEDLIYQPTDFILSIFNAYEKRKLEKKHLNSNRKLEQSVKEILSQKQIIGKSKEIQNLRTKIKKCAIHETNVLINGESGTGKELVAANIHYQSSRRFETFLPVNCGSLPDHLIESELFGFEKGSFTGAGKEKSGFFEIADKGTLFLDEITELPMSTQSTLLRVLQDGEIDKIGRQKKIEVDVRIIAATNKDLKKQVKEKHFREDLYYRLNVVSILAPPLRGRYEDIELLIEHYLTIFSRNLKQKKLGVSPEARKLLIEYQWPGNVRELQNVIQRLLISSDTIIKADDVTAALGINNASEVDSDTFILKGTAIESLREMEKKFRKQYLSYIRKQVNSDAEAARILGLAPSNYYRMCKKLGLK